MNEAIANTPQAYIDEIDSLSMAPLWGRLRGLVPEEPKSQAEPTLWDYDAIRKHVIKAGDLVSAKEAERRVLILENPALKGSSRIADSLFAGLQLIMPGEVAPAHRHSQSALRFVLDGGGAYTTVGGERTNMNFGDFVVTPPWRWHDHGNHSDEPMVWLDGLDLPMVKLFSAGFEQDFPTDEHPVTRPEGDALARYGEGLLPVDEIWKRPSSPVFNYPYIKSRAAIERASKNGDPDPFHGYRLRYSNPIDGSWAMPTIATYLRKLPANFSTGRYRSTESSVFIVTEGTGSVNVGGKVLSWKPRDIFVIPAWAGFTLSASTDAFLFNYSDRAAQDKLGFFMEQRGNDAPAFPLSD